MYVNELSSTDEAQVISQIVELFLSRQEKTFHHGDLARRALHGKSLGTVAAKFRVRELAKELQVGLFAQAKTYDALIRFSNGGLSAKAPDLLPNIRGMALKISGVDGEKVLIGAANEQDFIMANFPTFFVSTAKQMLMLFQGKILPLLIEKPEIPLVTLAASGRLIRSLLTLDYYGQMPHCFGERPCKYALLWQSKMAARSKVKNNYFDKDYLRHNLSSSLKESSAEFVFCVQFQQEGESIADPTELWRGHYIPLADLSILQRKEEIKESEGEELSFNPAHSLTEHRPIEWPARMRQAVYQADFNWRAKKNASKTLS